MRIERIFAYKFEIPFVPHSFFKDEVVLDGGLLLADSPGVDLIENNGTFMLHLQLLLLFFLVEQGMIQ